MYSEITKNMSFEFQNMPENSLIATRESNQDDNKLLNIASPENPIASVIISQQKKTLVSFKTQKCKGICKCLCKFLFFLIKYSFCAFLLYEACEFYKQSLIGCDMTVDKCLSQGYVKSLIDIGFNHLLKSIGCLCLYFFFVFYKVFHWITLLPFIGAFYYLFYTYDIGSDFAHHGSYNRFFMIVLMFLGFLVDCFIFMVIWLIRKHTTKTLLTIIVILLFIVKFYDQNFYNFFERRNENCVNWPLGFKNSKMDSSSCYIKPPTTCSLEIYDNVFDMTLWSQASCNSLPNNDKSIVEQYTKLKNVSIVGYPRVENWDWKTKSMHAKYYDFVYKGMFDMENPKIPQSVKDQTEAWVDFTKNPPVFNIDVKKNNSLATQRSKVFVDHKESLPVKNVILLFFDSLSRNAFKRKMKKTYQWLESLYDSSVESKYESFQFFKYHSIAEHTNPNIIPLFHGVAENNKEGENMVSFFKNKGFITGTGFNDCTRDFINIYTPRYTYFQPYDHEFSYVGCDPNFGHPPDRFALENSAYGFRIKCLYNKLIYSYVTEYAEQFLDKYSENAKFAAFGSIDAHEITQEVVKYVDQEAVDFLMRIEKKGHLENSVLLIFSDHGAPNHMLNFLPYGKGEDNRIENFLPFISMVLPKKMKNFQQIKENLRFNENKFITTFDLEVSLLDIIGEKSKFNKEGRNILEKITNEKNCNSFKISINKCQCLKK